LPPAGYSGHRELASRKSLAAKPTPAANSGNSVHHYDPRSADQQSDAEKTKGPGAQRPDAALHIKHPLAIRMSLTQP
jgi:hypothetical protein